MRNNLDLARTIIKNATDIDERDDDGCTALHTAARFSGFDAVQLLLQHGASSKVFDKVRKSKRLFTMSILTFILTF